MHCSFTGLTVIMINIVCLKNVIFIPHPPIQDRAVDSTNNFFNNQTWLIFWQQWLAIVWNKIWSGGPQFLQLQVGYTEQPGMKTITGAAYIETLQSSIAVRKRLSWRREQWISICRNADWVTVFNLFFVAWLIRQFDITRIFTIVNMLSCFLLQLPESPGVFYLAPFYFNSLYNKCLAVACFSAKKCSNQLVSFSEIGSAQSEWL